MKEENIALLFFGSLALVMVFIMGFSMGSDLQRIRLYEVNHLEPKKLDFDNTIRVKATSDPNVYTLEFPKTNKLKADGKVQ